jgi:hypothetical protein
MTHPFPEGRGGGPESPELLSFADRRREVGPSDFRGPSADGDELETSPS